MAEPLLKACREQSRVVYQVIATVRRTLNSKTTSPSSVDELEEVYSRCVGDAQLVRLLSSEGPRLLQDVAAARSKLGDHNVDARFVLSVLPSLCRFRLFFLF